MVAGPIGIFDSGMGGVTVLKEALAALPSEDWLYYADTAHVPYGRRTTDEVRELVLRVVERLEEEGIKALVVACNTATSAAVQDLRARFPFPVVGMEPAVKPAVRSSGGEGRVLVCATPLTLREKKFRELVASVDTEGVVDSLGLPELVEFAESLCLTDDVVLPYLRGRLEAFPLPEYAAVVLGCTHFPLFRRQFRMLLPESVELLDGNQGTVRQLGRVLAEAGLAGGGTGTVRFLSSGDTLRDEERFRILLDSYQFR